MSGKHITPRQVATYMRERADGHSQQQAADRAGISIRTARRLDHGGKQAKGPRTYRTRPDAFEKVWDHHVVPLLRTEKPLQAKVMFAELQRRCSGQFPDSLLRTFERRVRSWRALHGPAQETYFPQEHPPGWQGIADFTVCDQLGVTIGGQPLPHRLGHFRLAYSGWSSAHVILGGESFAALAETLRIAFEHLDGIPTTLRTDSLSAAFKNLSQQHDLTQRFLALCHHYGCDPTRNNRGQAHENGSIESPNGHLKTALDQALILRGSRDFADLAEYRAFVDGCVDKRNQRCRAAFSTERAHLRPLPPHPPVTWTEAIGVVSYYALIRVLHKYYMVPPRLNGHRLVVRIYDDRLEFFDGRNRVYVCPRIHRADQTRHVNYHLIIDNLVRKPGALARLIYRDDLHPRPVFARTWMHLRDRVNEAIACRIYVRLLHLAHTHACEDALASRLESLLARGELPDVEALRAEFAVPRLCTIPTIALPDPNPTAYDRLLALPSAPSTPAIPA